MNPLSQRMRDARDKAGLSQGELARRAAVHPTYISHVENGRRGLGHEALARVAEALGVTSAYLLDGEEASDYRSAGSALVEARRLSRMGEPRAAAEVLRRVDVSGLDIDTAARFGLALAETLDLAGDLEASIDALETLCGRLIESRRYPQAAYAAMRIVMALTEVADLHRAVARGEHLLAQLPASAAGSDEVVRLESTIIWAYIARGDTTYARYRGRQLLAHTRQHGSARAVSSVHWNLAFVDDALGDPDAALAQLESAIALAGTDEIDRDLPRLRLDRALLLVSVDPPRAADALADLDAVQTALEVGESQIELARAESVRSRVWLLLDDPVAAQRHAARAVELLREGVRRDSASAHEALGDAMLAQRSRPEAVKEYRSAAELLDMISSGRSAAVLWRRIGDRLRVAGDDDERVVEAYGRALAAAGIRGTLPAPPPHAG
ncbi:helix-turn-helix domain-containing protein [Cellulomonas fengjieae]|uniref:Helix-turn-helix transcriptional regulator n=1 Tax=Cellulomonas fengjieae TaxID=2819978 RepID=A0ABS3SLK3_9CELL|nr:helix-turn-helix transcriptional regulator [Cellulomonas fengjieae]MBO3086602.1 helix-turn-helix transcriptional regulator [Cellulomonas fengjieae]MBO3100595.1 helix-turn-helix transcriptional regulator [Cellulomonas fengjieae]QVI66549.1 helix-turn-helix transcriptional regulator [Cellulomonas fengjieae]